MLAIYIFDISLWALWETKQNNHNPLWYKYLTRYEENLSSYCQG